MQFRAVCDAYNLLAATGAVAPLTEPRTKRSTVKRPDVVRGLLVAADGSIVQLDESCAMVSDPAGMHTHLLRSAERDESFLCCCVFGSSEGNVLAIGTSAGLSSGYCLWCAGCWLLCLCCLLLCVLAASISAACFSVVLAASISVACFLCGAGCCSCACFSVVLAAGSSASAACYCMLDTSC